MTFADLMGLLVAFFVMLVAFSTPGPEEAADRRRLDARSLRRADRDALFRHHRGRRPADPAEAEERRANIKPEDASATPSPDEKSRSNKFGARLDNEGSFALASASLRQALQDLPEIAEISKHIMFEETKQGLNIEIVDQDGRSMFPEGSKEPLRAHAPPGAAAGRAAEDVAVPHHDRRPHLGDPAAGAARLRTVGPSADRANAIRKILEEEGVPAANSSWWPAGPTPSRCFPTIPSSPPTAA